MAGKSSALSQPLLSRSFLSIVNAKNRRIYQSAQGLHGGISAHSMTCNSYVESQIKPLDNDSVYNISWNFTKKYLITSLILSSISKIFFSYKSENRHFKYLITRPVGILSSPNL